jgi:hypothetical protein
MAPHVQQQPALGNVLSGRVDYSKLLLSRIEVKEFEVSLPAVDPSTSFEESRSLGLFLWHCKSHNDEKHTGACVQVIDPKGIGAARGITRGDKLLTVNGKRVEDAPLHTIIEILKRAMRQADQVTLQWRVGQHAGRSHKGAAVLHQQSTLMGAFAKSHQRSTEGYSVVWDGENRGCPHLCVFPSKQAYDDALVQIYVYERQQQLMSGPSIKLGPTVSIGSIKADKQQPLMFYFEIKGLGGERKNSFQPFNHKFATKDRAALFELHEAVNDTLTRSRRNSLDILRPQGWKTTAFVAGAVNGLFERATEYGGTSAATRREDMGLLGQSKDA